MTTKTRTVTDSDIRAAVVAKGYSAASVTRYCVNRCPNIQGAELSGVWYALFVDGQCWGRRRTLAELLAMAKRGPLL